MLYCRRMVLRVTNRTRGKILADRAEEARSFWRRFRGLMGRQPLELGEGLHLVPCNGIHMFFMRFPIDALFLDRDRKVVKLIAALPPWRATSIYRSAWSVLELPAGVASGSGTQEGDQLMFEQLA
jgi:uncharacterized protein